MCERIHFDHKGQGNTFFSGSGVNAHCGFCLFQISKTKKQKLETEVKSEEKVIKSEIEVKSEKKMIKSESGTKAEGDMTMMKEISVSFNFIIICSSK